MSNFPTTLDRFRSMLMLVAISCGIFWPVSETFAVDDKDEINPVGRFVILESPLSDDSLGLVRRTALELQDVAKQEGREAYLILDLRPGISQFHHAFALAEFLTNGDLQQVKTVAWVSETLAGNNVLVALACNEIVMHPDASLGDMGNGKALSDDKQHIVQRIVDKRRNLKVTAPLANALMDPQASLIKITVVNEQGETEARLVSQDQVQQLLDQGAVVEDQKILIETGTPGLISGTDAQTFDVLATRVADDRADIAKLYELPEGSFREMQATETTEKVAYIQIHDVIDQVLHTFVTQQIARAVANDVELIIFEIDTPGGLLMVSVDLAETIADLSERDIKTVAYIPEEAISAGSIIAVGCDEIYMHPNAMIGDAIPLDMLPAGGFAHAPEKILSVEMEYLRQLADRKDRPRAVLEGFADADLEVFEVTHKTDGRKWYMSEDEIHKANGEWIKGPRIPESRGSVAIFVSGSRAHELKVAEAPVHDISELKERLGIPIDQEFRIAQRTWVDQLVFILNNEWMTGLLFFLAIVCIYIEMATMTGVFGIIAAVAFGVFFWSRMLGGTATGLELSLFLIGLACVAMEVFVIPGFGVFGLTGILLILGSLIMASITLSGLGLQYDLAQAGKSFTTFGVAMCGVIVFATIMSRYLPSIPGLNSMILMPPNAQVVDPNEPRLDTGPSSRYADLVGATGTTISVLRPSGKAMIEGRMIDVVSDGPYIPDGAPVSVVEATGNRVVVRQDTDDADIIS